VSAHWRAMVESHATNLNAHETMILAFIAEGADAGGVACPNVDLIAWLARCNAATVRKTISSLVDSKALTKRGPTRTYQLAEIPCPPGCPIHGTKPAAAPAFDTSEYPLEVVKTRAIGPTTATLPDATVYATPITCALERIWRDVFKSEPTPGVLRHMVLSVLATDRDVHGFQAAFAEYLRRLKDPMYLNLQKFASTWRVYLEPEKTGNVADQNARDFSAVFSVPSPRAVIAEQMDIRIPPRGRQDAGNRTENARDFSAVFSVPSPRAVIAEQMAEFQIEGEL